MKYISTRNIQNQLEFEDVILQGLASDGGLYVPTFLPKFSAKEIANMRKLSYQELFFEVTKHFIGDLDKTVYKQIIEKSYKNFAHNAIAPLKQLSDKEFLLELFHGPTLAFKDFALQFLGNLLDHILTKRNQEVVIVGATSGDTGSAAIWGCKACKHATIFILHPHNLVSAVQRKQMTTVLDKNVFNIALKGTFDDCQTIVKKMFINQDFLKGKKMVAVNSINWARIMAQIVYYFYCSIRLGNSADYPLSFSVPTGNFGDIYAGFLAKKMGLNINKLIVATNGNDILHRFLQNNDYSKDEMVETLSPSMNIQVSSNLERMLFDYYKQEKKEKEIASLMADFEKNNLISVKQEMLKKILVDFDSFAVDDEQTKQTIKELYKETAEVLDPHSAIGVLAGRNYINSEKYQGELVVNLATAHPAKFPEAIVSTGLPKPELPNFMKDLFEREEKFEIMEKNIDLVKDFIAKNI